MSENTQNNFLGGMNRDALPSMSPPNTYRTAVNAQIEDFDYTNFGLVNEPSNELCFKIEEGFEIAGWGYIEERDSFVVFSYNKETKISQIGVGNTKSCTYKIVLEDKDPERFINKFCFSPAEKIVPQFKHLRPCNDLWMYWSNGFTYYRLNLDADLCDIRYEDIVLFDCKCPAVIEAFVIEEGSDLLDVGAYQFACQLIDDDENKTNWFQISNPVYLTSDDNKRGDKSDKAILIEIDNLPKSFPKVAIAAIKTVGGIQTAEVLTKLYHNGKKITYIYRGRDNDDEPIEISEILSRKTGFIQGKDLIQRDGRLFLYNLKEEWNLDAQRYANRITPRFVVGKIPVSEAGRTLTLPRGELISIAAVYNYCDGTSSLGFHIPGRIGSPDDFTKVPTDDTNNCTECEKYKWQVENTAVIEENYCSQNIYELNSFAASSPAYRPQRTLYKQIDKSRFVFCKKQGADSSELHLAPNSCGGGGDCSGGCNGGSCVDGVCTEGTCPTLGLACSQCPYCNGSYTDPECFDNSVVGVECDECSDGSMISGDIVVGKVSCLSGECVDGLCVDTGLPCDFCATCGGGDWFIKVQQGSDFTEDIPLATEFDGCPDGEPIYDDEGCRIVGYKPAIVARGLFGYWESSELYPKTKSCDGSYLYGELAGQPIRHHLVPDESLIPFVNSRVNGVVCNDNPDNFEYQDADVFVIGLDLCDINLPPNPPKPYCPFNPVSFYWQRIDPSDRKVNARGMITHTFLGNIRNKQYAVPKNAVNSFEYYDRHLNTTYNGIERFRGGENIGLPIYNFHSPDTQFQKTPLTADRLLVPYEINGLGKRYGIYAEGEEPINMWSTTTNTKGARQNINLNKRTNLSGQRVVTVPAQCKRKPPIEVSLNICAVIKQGLDSVRVGTLKFQIFDLPELIESFTVTGELNIDGKLRPFTKTVNNTNELFYQFFMVKEFLGPDVSVVVANYQIAFTIREGDHTCRYRSNGFIDVSRTSCDKKIVIDSNDSLDKQEEETKSVPAVDKRCIKGISYAKADSIVNKEDEFTYSLLNLKRESSVYLEVEGQPFGLSNPIDISLLDSQYNGKGSDGDGTSDGSFMGDVFCHSCPIFNASAHHAILLNDSPSQYGRIESATYIPLGFNLTAEELICKRAVRFNIGDSYVGLYSFRRYSVVSDKVGTIDEQFPPEVDTLGDTFLGIDLIVKVDRLLCRHDCSDIPDSCINDNDKRKRVTLRDGFFQCWDGASPINGYTETDTYHPNTVNSLVHFWTESRINLWERQTGISDIYSFDFDKNFPVSKGAEVHYPKLKTLELDSNFPEDTPWNLAWLNRIAVKWRTVALLKRITIVAIKLMIILGITIAAAMANGALGVLVLLWLVFNDTTNMQICKWLYSMFKVKQCRPKCLDRETNCYIVDDDLLPFEDNYTGYNWDFNTQNTLETKIGMTDPYNTCICEVGEGNQIVYSQKQNPLSLTDAYKNFLPNSYLHIPASWGKIQSLFSWNNSFFAQTSDMIINIATADGIINLGNGQALEVITQGGDLRTNPKEIVSDVPEGYAGTRDPNAAINTQYGRFSIDREGKKIFQFSGGMPKEISNSGVREFLKENLDLELLKQYDYSLVDEVEGIGYRLGFDHRFNRLMITKVDYKVKNTDKVEFTEGKFREKDKDGNLGVYVSLGDPAFFENKSFTLSYDPISGRWISFHTYFPDGYAWDRDHMYTIKEGGFWKHGDKYGDYQIFYDEYHPHIIEFAITKSGIHTSFTDLEMDVEAEKYDGNEWVKSQHKTFNKGVFYNNIQSSGEVQLEERDHVSAIDAMKRNDDKSIIEWKNDFVRLNQLRDKVIDPALPIFDGEENGLKNINEDNIGKPKDNFEGRYMVARLILDDEETQNIKHLTKRVFTQQEVTVK